MTVSLRVLVPEETTNYVLNPQFRIDTSGWTANSATITRTLDRARFGVASLKVVTNGSALSEGVFYRAKNLVGISDNLTVSIYVRGAGKVRIRLIDNPRGKEYRSAAVSLDDQRWKRIEVSGNTTGSDDVRLYVETADNVARAVTFYVDGAQMERKLYSTTYCDGYQANCRWSTVENATISTRNPDTHRGGRWVSLAGPCRPDSDIYVTAVSGLGMPPLTISSQSFAQAPGSFTQGFKINERVVLLSFYVKHKHMRTLRHAPDLSRLHELRQQLIDLFKPDKTFQRNQEFIFEYQENGIPVYFNAHYDGGLEGEWDIRNEWVNSIPLRLVGSSPMIYEDDQEVVTLDFQDSYNPGAGKQVMFSRQNGVWIRTGVAAGPNDNVVCIAIGPDGKVYAGGDFTLCDTVPGTVRIAYWDGTAWNQMAGGANGAVRAIAFGLDGSIYAGGDFTTIGGVAANRIAKWNGTAWSALSTGLNAGCQTICIANNGVLYAGGDFTTAGGVTVNRIARWDGTWRACGTGTPGLNNTVRAIAKAVDGITLFVGGSFTDGGAGVAYFKTLDTNTNLFTSVSVPTLSPTAEVYAIVVGYDGSAYAGGTAGVWIYNGAGWKDTGGSTGTVYSLSIDGTGFVYAAGDFSALGNLTVRQVAMWGGSDWRIMDIVPNTPGTNRVDAIAVNLNNADVHIGMFQTTPTNTYAAGSTDVNNVGTAYASPIFYFIGPGTLYYIENRTLGSPMLFNVILQQNEELFVDTEKVSVYSLSRGITLYGSLPSTQLGLFVLSAGVNKMSVLFVKDVGAKATLLYTPQHWSVDAVGNPDSL